MSLLIIIILVIILVMTNNDNPHQSPHVYWYEYSQHVNDIERYYRVLGGYLCPDCQVIVPTFDIFKDTYFYASQFSSSKKILVRSINRPHQPPLQPSSTTKMQVNDNESSPPPIEQAPPPPTLKRQRGGGASLPYHFERVSTSMQRCHIGVHLTIDNETTTSITSFIEQHGDGVVQRLNTHLQNLTTYKIQLTALIEFRRVVQNEEEIKEWFTSCPASSFDPNNYTADLIEMAKRLDEKVANYSKHGSNWSVHHIKKLGFIIAKYSELGRLSKHSYIPTPPQLQKSFAIVNPQNKEDNLCFLYSILAILKYDTLNTNRQRVKSINNILVS